MEDHILREMGKLTQKATQAKAQGYYMEALQAYDEILGLTQKFYSKDSTELKQICEEIIMLCNILSMIYLQKESYDISLELLKKAELLTSVSNSLKAVTFNNLACYYRKANKLRIGLSYLEDALRIEYLSLAQIPTNDVFEHCLLIDNPSDTHLNICAILSQLNKHHLALQHAMKALVFIQSEISERHKLLRKLSLVSKVLKKAENSSPRQKKHKIHDASEYENDNQTQIEHQASFESSNTRKLSVEEAQQNHFNKMSKINAILGIGPQENGYIEFQKIKDVIQNKNLKPIEDRYVVLAIAYHNLGVENEFLKQYDQSEKSYEKAVNFAQLYLGKDHLMTKNLRKVLKSAKIQIKNSMLREFEKTATSNFKKLARSSSQNKFCQITKKPSTAATKSYGNVLLSSHKKMNRTYGKFGDLKKTSSTRASTTGKKPKYNLTDYAMKTDNFIELMSPRDKIYAADNKFDL